ncbi:hypothetical protein R5W23_000132 [Gemmata sp. JC673]|uniref:Uncharacterized protein n=1 Tax=Gemmata algarum TaxID=2975278 RepID=A0ABU5EQW7_9BACT|nr:hypothetical protein [Gemmata algarum]MDY3557605.1 hypothetical protein [Gemmata algarum]
MKDTNKAISYDQISGESEYTFDPGRFALPVAELPPTDPQELANWSPVVMVQAYAPQMKRTSRFYEKKTGTPPQIPTPKDAGAFQILSGTLVFDAPIAHANGTKFDWGVAGEYTFIQAVRVDPKDGFLLNGLPIELETQRQNAIQYGQGTAPSAGPVVQAGQDAKVGYAQAQYISFSDPRYAYNTPTYFPGQFLSDTMLNGA